MADSHRLTARPSTLSDAQFVGVRLRSADRREVKAASGRIDLPEALTDGILMSKPCFTILTPEQQPCALFGAVPDPDNKAFGRVWMLGTDELVKYGRDFLRQSKPWWDYFHRFYPVLGNLVDSRNTVHVRWLKWLGCSFVGEQRIGEEQILFKEFIHV